MRFESFVGLRFLRPKRRQVFISIIASISVLGVAVGVATLIVVISVISGFQEDMQQKILGTYSHLLILSFEPRIENYNEVIQKVLRHPEVKAASPFVYSEVMLSTDTAVSGVVLRGVDPATAGKVTSIGSNLRGCDLTKLEGLQPVTNPILPEKAEGEKEGRDKGLAETKMLPGIILGQELAAELRVFIGEEIGLVSPVGDATPAGMMPKLKKFVVVGLFKSGMYEFDAKFSFIHIKEAQEFFGLGDTATGIELKVDDIWKAREIGQDLDRELGWPFRTKDWIAMNQNLFSAIKLEKLVMFIILILITFVAALNIFSALYMLVMDKQKSIAILKTMGAAPRSVMWIFMSEGLVIGIIGSLLGCILGVGICLLQIRYGIIKLDPKVYYLTTLPMKFKIADFIITGVAALGLSFIATLIPARIASRTDAVQVLRYE